MNGWSLVSIRRRTDHVLLSEKYLYRSALLVFLPWLIPWTPAITAPLLKDVEHVVGPGNQATADRSRPRSTVSNAGIGTARSFPLKSPSSAKSGRYVGDHISLNFQDIEVRAVLRLLADFTGLNLVAGDTVTGNITLRLKNVPWDQALDIILKARGLSMRQMDNVVMVAPTLEMVRQEEAELLANRKIATLAPLHSEFIQINYAKADELTALLKSKENQLLSERGKVTFDERTNTLLVQDTQAKLEDIRHIQVRDPALAGVGTIQIPDSAVPLMVNLPVANPTSGVNFLLGKIGSYLLQLELTAMQREGRGEIISSPRVITSDNQEATIKVGQEIPYQEQQELGRTTVAFKEAVLELRVTPQITPDDRVIIGLKVKKDSADFTREVQGVPPIDTRSVETNVLVDNGETLVLGGVFERTREFSKKQVPWLGDLPLLGHLFKTTSRRDNNNELLIFVTPKILKAGGAAP